MKKNRDLYKGMIGTGSYILLALLWPIIKGVSVVLGSDIFNIKNNITADLIPPLTKGYFLGTDIYGRSVVLVLMEGIQYSLFVSFSISILSLLVGLFVGYLASSEKYLIRLIFDLITGLVFVFPTILLAILVMSILGQSFWGLIFCLVLLDGPLMQE